MRAIITHVGGVVRSSLAVCWAGALLALFVLLFFSHDLAARPGRDAAVFTPELAESLPLIRADRVHEMGITGKGVGVAIVDIFSPNPKDPCRSTHGAWVEGILKGVAPDANVQRFEIRTVPGSVRGACYVMSNAEINRALRQILAQRRSLGIEIVNLSWGGGKYLGACRVSRNETSDLIQALVSAGITVVAASGNEGFKNALLWPACLPEVISVGASFDYSSSQPEHTALCAQQPVVDTVTCYSNSAAFLDVLAPGSRASVSDQLSGIGTSASTAFASGVLALMFQVRPDLDPEQAKNVLVQTGKPVRDRRNGLTFPRVDALNAVSALLPNANRSRTPPTLKGDVNGDGTVNSQDTLMLISALGGVLTLSSEQKLAADVALPCDGEPNLGDLNTLKRLALEQTSSHCPETANNANGASTLPPPPFQLRGVRTSFQGQGVRFVATGEGIRSTQLTVFDLSGRLVFDTGTVSGNALLWPLLNDRGQRVANGVYLYVLRVSGRNEHADNATGKIAVVR